MSPANDTTLLRTKLHRPPVADDVVPRPHLLERLEQGREHSFTLVSTPAGYGKSTLLSGWLAAAPCRTAWVSLDDGDADPRVFLTYVVAALEEPFPGAFSRTRALLGAADLPPTRVLAAALVNELDALDDELILVLDDYHLVRSSAVHDIVSTLLTQRPRSLHLAIAARRDPPLPLASLRAAGQMTEVRQEDLRLSGEETAGFLARTVPAGVNAASAEALREATEGWPAGLRLASLSLRKGADVSRLVGGLHATGRHVMDYLAAEVLADVPPEIHGRLLATAILDRFCAPLCEALIGPGRAREGPDAGEAFVAWLEEVNLFVIPLDGQHRWLRYHHLFRELLQHRLSSERSSQEIARLHLDAAGWLARNGLPDEAIRHALAAGNPDFAVCVVEAHRHALMNREEWSRLERWLRLFPAPTAETDPQLLLVRAWLALEKRYELGDLERVIAQAEERIGAGEGAPASTAAIRAELAVMKGGLEYMTVPEGPALTETLREAVEALPRDHEYARGIGFMHLAAAHDQRGERSRAEGLLTSALEKAGPSGGADRAQILTTLCFLSWFDAAPTRLIQAAERLLHFGEREKLSRSVHFAHYFAGLGHHDRDDLPSAERHLRFVVGDPYVSALHNVAHSAFALALLQQAQGREDDARETARTIADLALELRNQYFVSLAGAFDAELGLRQGRRFEALQWARRYDPHPLQALPRVFVPQLTWLRVLLAEDTAESRSRAGAFLAEWQPHVERLHHTRYEIDTLLLRALWARADGQDPVAEEALARAVALARPGGVTRPFLDAGPQLAELLGRLRLDRDDAAFARDVLTNSGDTCLARAASADGPAPPVSPLSDREAETLALLAQRLSNKEIAEKLHITPETVKRHTANIYQKLDVHGRREAVERATSLGVLRVP